MPRDVTIVQVEGPRREEGAKPLCSQGVRRHGTEGNADVLIQFNYASLSVVAAADAASDGGGGGGRPAEI